MDYIVIADRIFMGLFRRIGDAKRWKKELETYPVNWHQYPAIIAVSGDTAPLHPDLSCFNAASHRMYWKHYGRRLA